MVWAKARKACRNTGKDLAGNREIQTATGFRKGTKGVVELIRCANEVCTLKTEQRNVKRSKVLEDCKSQVKETDCYDSPKRDKRIT